MGKSDLIASLQRQIDQIDGTRFEKPRHRNRKSEPGHSDQALAGHERAELDEESAFNKIVTLLNASDKPESVIRDRLSRLGYAQDDIDGAVQRAKDYGFVNDARYADVLARSRISQGRGVCGIERELESYGIDIGVLDGWPEEYGSSGDGELQRALDLLERKPPRSKNAREGAYRKLVGKGYASSVASSAARIWAESQA